MGSSEDLLEEFQAAGGKFSWFQSLDPKRNRFFLNLRNHRKLQVVDGLSAFVGGMNIGREYEGLDEALGHWRDVQVEAQGAVVSELQDVFADDWFFATGEKISSSDPPTSPEYSTARRASSVARHSRRSRTGATSPSRSPSSAC
jgi:cardiolipin synthase